MLNDIVSDLIFIREIPLNAKPNFSDRSYTFVTEWFSTWKRRMKSEKGESGIIYVETLLFKIEKYWNTWLIEDQKKVKLALTEAKIGFQKIVSTYRQDGQHNIADGYRECWARIEKWLSSVSVTVEKKFFNYTPKLCLSQHSQGDDT